MRSGTYSYPADEFDAAARTGGPRGVHRAPRTRWSRWWPFVVVLIVFPALAYGIVTFLSDWDGFGDLGSDSAEQQEPAGNADGDPVEPDPTDPGAEEPAETPTETEPAPPPPPPADLSRPVDVFNSTNTSGLARNGADRLTAAGFTTIDVADWDGDDPATSVVYYGVATDVTTAQQVAAALGLPATALVESAEQAPDGIVVVLADDYQRA